MASKRFKQEDGSSQNDFSSSSVVSIPENISWNRNDLKTKNEETSYEENSMLTAQNTPPPAF